MSVAAENTQDWERDSFSGFVGAFIAQIIPIGGRLFQFQFEPKIFYGDSKARPDWGLRLGIVLLFSK